jgi:hypothetical protein
MKIESVFDKNFIFWPINSVNEYLNEYRKKRLFVHFAKPLPNIKDKFQLKLNLTCFEPNILLFVIQINLKHFQKKSLILEMFQIDHFFKWKLEMRISQQIEDTEWWDIHQNSCNCKSYRLVMVSFLCFLCHFKN